MSIRISTSGCRPWNREMAASKRSHTKLEMIWIEILPRTSSVRLPSLFGTLRTSEFERAACLGNQHAFVGQLESAWSAPAQRHAELGLEAFERETECRLLAPQRAPGAADPAGLGDLVERLQEIPIDIAGEIRA